MCNLVGIGSFMGLWNNYWVNPPEAITLHFVYMSFSWNHFAIVLYFASLISYLIAITAEDMDLSIQAFYLEDSQ